MAPPLVNQCNGTDNVGGQAARCTVTVTNTLNLATGVGSSTVVVNECHGAANAPLTCITSTTTSNQVVQSVTQCNGSGSGGGGTVTCSVEIVNNIRSGLPTTLPATVNQCIGSGQGGGIQPTTACTPLGSTTNATVTQCNGSGNGGGGTIRVQCTVLPSTQTTALPVTVDQCNGSGNGGGATVTCSSSVTNNFIVDLIGPKFPIGTGVPPPGVNPPTRPARPGVGPSGSAPPFLVSIASPGGLGAATGGAGSLARTGSATGAMSIVALLSIFVGAILLGLSRRRTGLRTSSAVATTF